MSHLRIARPFVIDDLRYRPFGQSWLQGVTPTRMMVLAAVCVCYSVLRMSAVPLVQRGFTGWYMFCVVDMAIRHIAAGLPLLVFVAWTERATVSWSGHRRFGALATAVLLGAVAHAVVIWGFTSLANLRNLASHYDAFAWWFLNLVFQAALWGGLATGVSCVLARARSVERLRHEAELDSERIERGIAEARLQLLRAQIEPHFLFNTLASVKRLNATEPLQARELVRNLRHYLSVAIPGSRAEEVTLREEVALARSYLEILQVRMGERLKIGVDVRGELGDALLPPLMLGTLVENAVKHGIAPRASGGSVCIEAAAHGGMLHLCVVDDGVGFRGQAGHGVGLANTRARLQALFGDRARLGIGSNAAGGVTAELCIPLRFSPASRLAA